MVNFVGCVPSRHGTCCGRQDFGAGTHHVQDFHAATRALARFASLLHAGTVPGLFNNKEQEAIAAEMRPLVEASGGSPGRDACLASFTARLRERLHVVLTMNGPVDSVFQARMRSFPALVDCCTIDYHRAWPDEALLEVSSRTLADAAAIAAAAPPPANDPTTTTSTSTSTTAVPEGADEAAFTVGTLSRMCVAVHRDVEAAAARFWAELRRRVHVTPQNCLDFMALYCKLLHERRYARAHVRMYAYVC